MTENRSRRNKKSIDYSKFGAYGDDDDDFAESTPPPPKKIKQEAPVMAKKSINRKPLDEKLFDRDLTKALELSILESSPACSGGEQTIVEVEPSRHENKTTLGSSSADNVLRTTPVSRNHMCEEDLSVIEVLEENVPPPNSKRPRKAASKAVAKWTGSDDDDDSADEYKSSEDDPSDDDDYDSDSDSDFGTSKSNPKIKAKKDVKPKAKQKCTQKQKAKMPPKVTPMGSSSADHVPKTTPDSQQQTCEKDQGGIEVMEQNVQSPSSKRPRKAASKAVTKWTGSDNDGNSDDYQSSEDDPSDDDDFDSDGDSDFGTSKSKPKSKAKKDVKPKAKENLKQPQKAKVPAKATPKRTSKGNAHAVSPVSTPPVIRPAASPRTGISSSKPALGMGRPTASLPLAKSPASSLTIHNGLGGVSVKSPSCGLRLGLSKNRRGTPLHPNVKIPH